MSPTAQMVLIAHAVLTLCESDVSFTTPLDLSEKVCALFHRFLSPGQLEKACAELVEHNVLAQNGPRVARTYHTHQCAKRLIHMSYNTWRDRMCPGQT